MYAWTDKNVPFSAIFVQFMYRQNGHPFSELAICPLWLCKSQFVNPGTILRFKFPCRPTHPNQRQQELSLGGLSATYVAD